MRRIARGWRWQWRDSYLSVITVLLLLIVIAAMVYSLTGSRDVLVANEDAASDTKVIEMIPEELPHYAVAPDIAGIVGWINSEPLTAEDLRGKVVLVDFWTYSCINCIRTLPYVQSWHEKYQDRGLVLLGVHTPEFDFEKRRENIVRAAEEHGLTYPIAMDSDYVTWRAFGNRYWPAHYLIDADGDIRYVHFGEGKYAETEAAIQQLLIEGGLAQPEELAQVGDDDGEPATHSRTPEIYFGYERIDRFGSKESVVPDEAVTFTAPTTLATDTFYLEGSWTVGPEAARLTGERGAISLSYQAKEVNMVLADGAGETLVEVTLDGAPLPQDVAGQHVIFENGRSYVRVGPSQLYNLVATDAVEEHVLRLEVTSPTFEAFTFTFG